MQICQLCGLEKENVHDMRIRVTPPVDGVVDAAYEHDYNVPVCVDCRTRVNFACAMKELDVIREIMNEARERRKRAYDRAAFLLAMEDLEELKVNKKLPVDLEGDYGNTDSDDGV